MATIAKFIGVGKYEDKNIRDLTGANSDATAFWALFSDTLPDIQAELLVDNDATVENIRKAIAQSLGAASPDDVIILFYSGHGSHDHRLATHDTKLTDLANTTISMQEIADSFKKSRAKSIICILDCCFSGGAPAKVLEDSPIPRDPGNPFLVFQGEGRMIIAASNFDEPSYELPSTGHGILSKAVLDVLQSPELSVNFITAMNSVMEVVRTEANRMGVTQTPVILNFITGGLTLPSLKPGARYFAAFPQRKGIKVSKQISELAQFGLPTELVAEWASQFKDGLNDLQLTAINDFRILDGESLFVIAPTSSGKTFVGELASIRAIIEGRKAVFLLPYKALVNEKYEQFEEMYSNRSGYRVIRCTGDYLDQNAEFIRGKYDIAFFTYEMFLNLSVSLPMTLNNIGLVVLDEAQFVTDPTRGIAVELLLTSIISARQRDINPQLVVLSAVIGDSNFFEEWLGCQKLVTHQRPVPLIEGVLDRSGRYKHKDDAGEIKQEQLLSPGSVYQRKSKPQAQDLIVPLVRKLVQQGEKVIVFRNRKGPAEGCAGYLSKELGLESALKEMREFPKHLSSTTSQLLKDCLSGGVAFHNSNLSRDERVSVERAFRNPNSKIRVLAATTTVAAGINTPASTVILAEQEFKGEDGRPFTVAEYKNMAGRAGRVGFENEQGKAIILADAGHNPENLFSKYVLGKLNDLSSSFKLAELDTWIIRLLAQVRNVKKNDLVALFTNTFGGYVASRRNPEWKKEIALQVTELYKRMLELGLVEEENDTVLLTLLGKACGESVFSFRSAMRFIELLKTYTTNNISVDDLMAIIQALPETDAAYTPMFRKGTSESRHVHEAALRFGSDVVRLLQKYTGGDEFKYYARCKRAAVLFDWTRGVPTHEIEERFKSRNPYIGNIGYGDIRGFADLTRFQLRSAYKLVTILFPESTVNEEHLELLLKQLELGIPSDCVGLTEIPIQLSREEYLALHVNGIHSPEQLLSTDMKKLTELLEANTINRLPDFLK
jgi:replicative superfamily II helicase